MKKAQSIIISFIAILTILIIFIPLFISEFDSLKNKGDSITDLEGQAKRIANSVVGVSLPPNWVSLAGVKKIGLVDGDSISNNTLDEFAKLSYSHTKKLFAVTHDYVFFFTNQSQVSEAVILAGKNEYWGYNISAAYTNGGVINTFSYRFNETISKSRDIARAEKFVKLRDIKVEDSPMLVKLIVYVW